MTLHAPIRPLPPLLPLSDPGPRLLPSTLALHRATHLLNSRNLHVDPLPHPLPPSLHPPAPVDVSEFDIDFILAGSRAQLGGSKANKNAPIDVVPAATIPSVLATPTLKLGPGGEDEDSFAKFVGAFDDEYDDRRGEWSFRACPRPSAPLMNGNTARDPLDRTHNAAVRAEWESSGAGKYELYESGDVRSLKTGSRWSIRKCQSREYELKEATRGKDSTRSPAIGSTPSGTVRPTIVSLSEHYVLASKFAHCEAGGVKLPLNIESGWVNGKSSRQSSQTPKEIPAPALRVTISDTPSQDRKYRLGNSDSTSTSKPGPAQSLPSASPLSQMTPKKKQIGNRSEDGSPQRGRSDTSNKDGRSRSRSRDRDDEKSKKGFGGVLKRGMASLKPSAIIAAQVAAQEEKKTLREEREREKAQSQSWSPRQSYHQSYIYPTGKNVRSIPLSYRLAATERTISIPGGSTSTSKASSFESKSPRASLLNPPPENDKRSPSVQSSPQYPTSEEPELPLRSGKAWSPVPEEAIAMVVPIEKQQNAGQEEFKSFVDYQQALLVWYVPFNSEDDTRDAERLNSVSTSTASGSKSSSDAESTSHQSLSQHASSLPKFQKLLRRRASKDKDAFKKDNVVHPPKAESEPKVSCAIHPLPFRSFRVVACVVDVEDLRSETDVLAMSPSFDNWPESIPRSGNVSANVSPYRSQPSLPSTDEGDGSTSTGAATRVLAGRAFPTVIAVCHSRAQGVEFVLEGLDRLGFCQGKSAWGPTGYEEWRGSGLSEKGRELLDLLWAGCVCVMGLVTV
jgi:hypothetical protein